MTPTLQSRRRWWNRAVQWLAAQGPVSRAASKFLPPIDRSVLRLTGNRYTLTSLLAGVPIVTLTSTGAKSGQPRTVTLLGIPDGNRIVLIASSFGKTRHPAWYHNLKANPRCTLSFGGQSGTYIAREAKEPQRSAYYEQAVQIYPGFAAYEKRAGERRIPVMVLTPERALNLKED